MDKNRMKARAFLQRAGKAASYESALFCLFDGFVCLYGPSEAMGKLAELTGIDEKRIEKAIECCRNDVDGRLGHTILSESEMRTIREVLESMC
jgi:hypothetical protein